MNTDPGAANPSMLRRPLGFHPSFETRLSQPVEVLADWLASALAPHGADQFKLSRDPEFVSKVPVRLAAIAVLVAHRTDARA
jgi:hypothetical protein